MKKKNVILIVLAVLLLGVFALRAEDDTGSPFIAIMEQLSAISGGVISIQIIWETEFSPLTPRCEN